MFWFLGCVVSFHQPVFLAPTSPSAVEIDSRSRRHTGIIPNHIENTAWKSKLPTHMWRWVLGCYCFVFCTGLTNARAVRAKTFNQPCLCVCPVYFLVPPHAIRYLLRVFRCVVLACSLSTLREREEGGYVYVCILWSLFYVACDANTLLSLVVLLCRCHQRLRAFFFECRLLLRLDPLSC